MKKFRRSGDRSRGGYGMVELAIVMPLLLSMLFGIMEFGVMFARYHVILDSARNGARVASLFRPNCSSGVVEAEAVAAIMTATSFLGMQIDDSHIKILGACSPSGFVRVTIDYDHDLGLIADILGRNKKFPLTATVMMRNEL